ncbi:hypothetical protein [Persicobacter psychrovividus]|uniref:Uncharacterized protein n=1 Tax=Persicobacter psychrovividus TaxID=387638 RepID=A0ABN6LF56_9BACT|nr:hypothetical protein PEPS_40960 [Persicobacter psychrovividus]
MGNLKNIFALTAFMLCSIFAFANTKGKSEVFITENEKQVEIYTNSLRFIDDMVVGEVKGMGWFVSPIEEVEQKNLDKAWAIYLREEEKAWNGDQNAQEWMDEQAKALSIYLWDEEDIK